MDRNIEYHWGKTASILSFIQKRDNSSVAQKLLEERIEIEQLDNFRLKKDNHGNHFWSTRRPDSKGRKRVIEVDPPLGNRDWKQVVKLQEHDRSEDKLIQKSDHTGKRHKWK